MIPIKLPKNEKDLIIERVQAYFEEERSEQIGTFAAEQMIDYMIKELGPFIYNQAITDVRKMLTQSMIAMDEELYALEKPLNNRK